MDMRNTEKQERQIIHLACFMITFLHEEDSVAFKLLECLYEETQRISS